MRWKVESSADEREVGGDFQRELEMWNTCLEEWEWLVEGTVSELPDGITVIHHTCHNRLDSELLEGKIYAD